MSISGVIDMEMNSNPTLSVFKNYTTIFLSIGKKIVLYWQIKEKIYCLHRLKPKRISQFQSINSKEELL